MKRLEKLHNVFCNEFNVLTIAGSTATNDADRIIYQRCFPEGDEEDDYKGRVNDIWNKLFNFNAQTPSGFFATFIIDNNDWKKAYGETPGADLSPDAKNLDEAAYTDIDEDDQENPPFWVTALENLDLAKIDCSTLDTCPSWQMENTGRVILHEFTHYSTVGPDSLLNDIIVDAKDRDDEYAYESPRALGLLDPDQDDQSALAVINADNYALMATFSI